MNVLLIPRRAFASEFQVALRDLRRQRQASPEAQTKAYRKLVEADARRRVREAGEDA